MVTQPVAAGKGKGAKSAKGGSAKRHRKQTATSTKLAGPAIRRLARRGGAQRVGRGCFPEVNTLTNAYLTAVLDSCKVYCTHAKRKTINCQDVVYALRRIGVKYMGHPFK